MHKNWACIAFCLYSPTRWKRVRLNLFQYLLKDIMEIESKCSWMLYTIEGRMVTSQAAAFSPQNIYTANPNLVLAFFWRNSSAYTVFPRFFAAPVITPPSVLRRSKSVWLEYYAAPRYYAAANDIFLVDLYYISVLCTVIYLPKGISLVAILYVTAWLQQRRHFTLLYL